MTSQHVNWIVAHEQRCLGLFREKYLNLVVSDAPDINKLVEGYVGRKMVRLFDLMIGVRADKFDDNIHSQALIRSVYYGAFSMEDQFLRERCNNATTICYET
jgi:hypothetical protein